MLPPGSRRMVAAAAAPAKTCGALRRNRRRTPRASREFTGWFSSQMLKKKKS